MHNRFFIAAVGVLLAALIATGARAQKVEIPYTTEFGLASNPTLTPHGSSTFFSLEPGAFWRYEGIDEDGQFVEILMTVTDRTRLIEYTLNNARVRTRTRVVEEREWINGVLAEVSLNYYARSAETGSIFYYGEEVALYENGHVVSNEGSWLAGENGALPGLLMPGQFLLGARYYQEQAPGVSMDRAEHIDMGVRVTTPAGTFENCVLIFETTPLEDDDETLKRYAPGVGLITDGSLELVAYGR